MQRKFFRLPEITLALALCSGSALAIDPGTKDPRKVARAVETRERGDKVTSRVTLSLLDASGRKRVRKTRQQSIRFADGHKTIMFFESPATVRNTGMLSIDYKDGKREDEQWLHMPNLHKTTRIAGAEKSQSFMGTDLTYADMTTRDTKLYKYKMLESSTVVDGEECWLIEARPKTAAEKKATGYLKTHSWIGKKKLLPIRVKAWVIDGKKLKYLQFSDIAKVDGIWIAKRLVVTTKRNKTVLSKTVMQISEVKFKQPKVTEAQFSKRRLAQGL